MSIRCDNCSVSLQLDESKIPGGKFSVRCPRCQNLLRVDKGATALDQLASQQAAPVAAESPDFKAKEHDLEINNALKSLMSALQTNQTAAAISDEAEVKPRRSRLCLGARTEETAERRAKAGYKVYVAQTPAQANER